MLHDFYVGNGVPEEDRILLPKDIVLTIPDRDYDLSGVLETLGLSKYEVAVTWPKKSVDMLAEISVMRPKSVVQVGRRFFRKFLFLDERTVDAIRERIRGLVTADKFVGLHHHDEFSLRDGLGTVNDLIKKLKQQKRSFCCVTNHGSVGGWVKQYKACREAGVKPIFGMEAYMVPNRSDDPEEKKKQRSANHLLLLAANTQGYRNIINIHNDAQLNGFYYSPRADWKAIEKWGSGIISTSTCMAGEIPRALMADDEALALKTYEFYASAFDRYFIEIQLIEYEPQREANKRLIKFAKKVGAPLIMTGDSHYLEADHADTHDVLMYMRQKKTIKDSIEGDDDVWSFDARNIYYRNFEEMRKLFVEGYSNREGKHPPFLDEVFTEEVFEESISNTREVAVQVEDIELDSTIRLPKMYDDAPKIMKEKINKGFKQRNLHLKPNKQEYVDRILREFDVIAGQGWADYFLIMEKIVSDAIEEFGEWAVGWGRGCFHPSTRVVTERLFPKFISDIDIGDKVATVDGSFQEVLDKFEYQVDEEMIEVENTDGVKVLCTLDHKWFVRQDDGKLIEKRADELLEGDDLVETVSWKKQEESEIMPQVKKTKRVKYKGPVFDLKVAKNSTYNVEGMAVHNSAGGSLISYCLRITDVDPLKYGLLFERFMDEGRKGALESPDIDTDFSPRVRDWVKEHIVELFGEDNTCSIGTYNTLKTKGVITEVAKTLGLSYQEAKTVTKKLESLRSFESDDGEEDIVDNLSLDELESHYPELKEFFDNNEEVKIHSAVIRNQVSHMGKHAGGMIISGESLKGRIPVLRKDDLIVSAWAESGSIQELSHVGLVKFDLLGLNNLPIISDCVDLIKQTEGRELRRDDMPVDSKREIKSEALRDLVGIFQLEHPSTKPIVDAVRADSLDDIAAITSLLRPGPRDMGMDMEYATRKNSKGRGGLQILRDLLPETYGILVYQENAMKVAQLVAGFTPVESNKLRKAIGKKLPEVMALMKGKFISGAQTVGGLSEKDANELWNQIESFAGYGFNKSVDRNTNVVTKYGVKRICDMSPGDMVQSYDGESFVWTEVVDVHDHGILPGYEVTFDDGSKEICSINHKFLTRFGQKPLWQILRESDEVVAVGDLRRVLSVRLVGERQMFDLEVRHESHNFTLASGIVTSNSHAIAYSIVSTVQMWLKSNWPVQYMTALLNNTKTGAEKHGSKALVSYINYARRRGIAVLNPDVNCKEMGFTIEDGAIRFSLRHVKQVASGAAHIIECGPYDSMEDFFEKARVPRGTKTQKPNKGVVSSLIAAGAFDRFGSRNEMSEQYFALRKKKGETAPKFSDTGWESEEVTVLGLCLSSEPLYSVYRERIEKNGWCPIGEQSKADRVKLFGRILSIESHVSQKGNKMLKVVITDDLDSLMFYVFANGIEYFKDQIKPGDIGVIPMKRFDDGGARFFDDNKEIKVLQRRKRHAK